MITTEQIKELRDATGVSVMQCKKALEEAGGDKGKALVILKKQSSKVAEKKADRELGSGVVEAYIHNTKKVGAMVLLSCETDFVAKNDEFVSLARDIAMHIAAADPSFKNREQVTEADISKAKEVFTEEAKDKPAEIQEKIISGKVDAYLKEQVLLEQGFIKDPEKRIGDLLSEATQKFGERIEISEYVRYVTR